MEFSEKERKLVFELLSSNYETYKTGFDNPDASLLKELNTLEDILLRLASTKKEKENLNVLFEQYMDLRKLEKYRKSNK